MGNWGDVFYGWSLSKIFFELSLSPGMKKYSSLKNYSSTLERSLKSKVLGAIYKCFYLFFTYYLPLPYFVLIRLLTLKHEV